MTDRRDLFECEFRAWHALSSDGDTAARFFADVLAEEVLMLLPGGLVIAEREQAIEAMSGAPWDSFDLSDMQLFELDERTAVVAYRGTAVRSGTTYEALFSSLYVSADGVWRMAFHQQTPV